MNPQLLLWPAIYTCLCWLIFLLAPSRVPISGRSVLGGALVYVFYNWPLWVRNFIVTAQGRTVYGYPNVDVHWPSFIVQEVTILGFGFLIYRIWELWSVRETLRPVSGTSVERALHPARIRAIADGFHQWQICSVILALGFLFFTRFFWNIVTTLGDQRYMITALLAHTLWGVTWLVMSIRVFHVWRLWSDERDRAILETSLTNDKHSEGALETLRWASPVGTTSVVSTAIVSFAGFLYPLAEKIIR
jgi:hypothetical protein